MKSYEITFIGGEIGAIGITHRIVKRVEAHTIDEAILKLYDTHEHISVTSVIDVNA